MTRLDSHTRDSHRLAAGQARFKDEPFQVGDAALMEPRNPLGPPEETFNCRCTVKVYPLSQLPAEFRPQIEGRLSEAERQFLPGGTRVAGPAGDLALTLPEPPEKPMAEVDKILSPTGNGIRSDAAGDGHFGASRDSGTREHLGVDLLSTAGQDIFAPASGRFTVTGQTSAAIEFAPGWKWQLLYIKPDKTLNGRFVNKGDIIGVAEDLSQIYNNPSMENHVHLQLVVPKGTPNAIYSNRTKRYFLDPTPFITLPEGGN